jgi:hypothetical protein
VGSYLRVRVAGVAVALAVVGVMLGVTSPAVASVPLSWSSPALVDGQPPYAMPKALSAVSCPSGSLCVGVDYWGNVVTATDPTGGASAWTVAPVDPNGPALGFVDQPSLTGVSCPSVSLCVAVDRAGNVLTSANPTGGSSAWTVAHCRERFSGPYERVMSV